MSTAPWKRPWHARERGAHADAEPWAVVAMSTGHSKNDLEMAPSVRHVRHRGAGCYRWIVASQSGAGRYRFYFTADLD